MKKFIISIVLTILFFSFACQKGVQAETATCFGTSISITTQQIDFDPSELVALSVWSYLANGSEFIPGRYFFEHKAYPAYAGILPYRSEIGGVSVNKGDFLKLSLYCEGILPEDVLCTFCRVSGGGLDQPVLLINQKYMQKFQVGNLNQDTFKSIAEQVEDLSEEEIISLNSPSIFYFDTSVCKNTEDLVFQFGIMHRGDRNRITIFIFSWEKKGEGAKVSDYPLGLQSPKSGLPVQGLKATGDHQMSGWHTGNVYAQTSQQMVDIKNATDNYYKEIYNNSVVPSTETSNPEKNREVNFLDLNDGQEFEVYQNSALLVNMGQYDGFQVLNPETGKVYFEHTFTDKESHGIQFPYDSLDGSLAIKIVAPDGASRVIILKKMKGSEKSEKN